MSQPENQRNPTIEVLIGLALSLVHLPLLLLSFWMIAWIGTALGLQGLGSWFGWIIVAAPLVAYAVGGVVIAKRRNRPGIASGLIIGSATLFLLISACFISLMRAFG